jgi:AcrR family transcriptional regulator
MSAQPRLRPDPNRARILAAATELFAVQGYAASTEEKLLTACELSPADFRAHFADPEECFLAAYDHATASARRRLLASIPHRAPWPERLAAGFRTLLELIDANAAPARLVLVESQFAGAAAFGRYMATVGSLAPFMHEGRELSPYKDKETLPSIVDSVLPGGGAFSLRCQLFRAAPVRALYPECSASSSCPTSARPRQRPCLDRPPRPEASTPPG